MLTIRDILKRPYFQHVTLFASEQALMRQVDWAHVLEVTDVGNLLNGNELILTTGLTWSDDQEKAIDFLNQIISRNAAGLAIDMGRVIHHVPEPMIRRAQEANFALILVNSDIRYIDVTHDIHTLIINRQKQVMENLEKLSDTLNSHLLRGEGVDQLLQDFNELTGKAVIYLPLYGHCFSVPKINLFTGWSQLLDEKGNGMSCPIIIMNQCCGSIIVRLEEQPDSFISLATDRLATAVGQEIMRQMYWQELQMNNESQWLFHWFEDRLGEREVAQKLWSIFPHTNFNRCAIAVFEPSNESVPANRSDSFHLQIALKTVLRNTAIHLLSLNRDHRLINVLLDPRERRTADEFKQVIIHTLGKLNISDTNGPTFTTGSWGISQIGSIKRSMKTCVTEALTVIDVQKHVIHLSAPFYTDLHSYQIVHDMEQNGRLQAFIQNEIGDLLKDSDAQSIDYIRTLFIYLSVGQIKKEAADRLYISRQSLYKRLDRLRDVLGDDFESPHRKLAIELALLGYQYRSGYCLDR